MLAVCVEIKAQEFDWFILRTPCAEMHFKPSKNKML